MDADEWCRAPGPVRGWMLVLEPTWVPPGLWGLVDAVWIGATAALALVWAPGLEAGVAGAGVLILTLMVAGAG